MQCWYYLFHSSNKLGYVIELILFMTIIYLFIWKIYLRLNGKADFVYAHDACKF